jgi:hypothetical protein
MTRMDGFLEIRRNADWQGNSSQETPICPGPPTITGNQAVSLRHIQPQDSNGGLLAASIQVVPPQDDANGASASSKSEAWVRQVLHWRCFRAFEKLAAGKPAGDTALESLSPRKRRTRHGRGRCYARIRHLQTGHRRRSRSPGPSANLARRSRSPGPSANRSRKRNRRRAEIGPEQAVGILPGIEGKGPRALRIAPRPVGRRTRAIGILPLAVRPNRRAGTPCLYEIQVLCAKLNDLMSIAAFLIGWICRHDGWLLRFVLGNAPASGRRMRVEPRLKDPANIACQSRGSKNATYEADNRVVQFHGSKVQRARPKQRSAGTIQRLSGLSTNNSPCSGSYT